MKKRTLTLLALTTICQFGYSQNTNCSAVNDDFSNPALWAHPVLSSTISNPTLYNTLNIASGTFNFQQSRDENFNYFYRTGLTINDNNFVAKIDFRHTSNGLTAGGAGHVLLALNSDNEPFFNSTSSLSIASLSPAIHDGISVSFESDLNSAPTDFFFQVYLNDGGTITPAGSPISVGGPLPSGSTDYFIELIRVSTTSGLLNIYSDPARTALINTSGWFIIPSTINTLNTVQIGTHEWQNQDRMLTGKLDNLCIDNSAPNTVTNLCPVLSEDFSMPALWAHPVQPTNLGCNSLATMTIAGGQFQFLQSRDNNFNYMNRSGVSISDTDFEVDIDFTHISNGVIADGSGHTLLALNAGSKPFFNDPTTSAGGTPCSAAPMTLATSLQKGIAISFESDLPTAPTDFAFKVYINNGSGAVPMPAIGSLPISVGPAGVGGLATNYYIRLTRTGTTSGTLGIYTSPSRTTLLVPATTFTIPASITGLNTLQIGGNEWQEENRMLTGNLDNLCIHNPSLGIKESVVAQSTISIFPNPAQNDLTISSSEKMTQIDITDLNGKIKMTTPCHGQTEKLNLTSFESGVYFIHVYGENGTSIEKFIKN